MPDHEMHAEAEQLAEGLLTVVKDLRERNRELIQMTEILTNTNRRQAELIRKLRRDVVRRRTDLHKGDEA